MHEKEKIRVSGAATVPLLNRTLSPKARILLGSSHVTGVTGDEQTTLVSPCLPGASVRVDTLNLKALKTRLRVL